MKSFINCWRLENLASKCEACLFAGESYVCRQAEVIKQIRVLYADKMKALLFLDHESARIDKVHCVKKFDDQLSFTIDDQKETALEDFESFLRKGASWSNEQPLSVLRRKYPASTSGLFPVRVHCRWKNCLDQACELRGRGRHCHKQQKISGYLQEA